MVYNPEPLEAGQPGNHPEAGQGQADPTSAPAPKATAAQAGRNERRKAQRAAAKSAKAHQASTGRDLDYSLTDRTEPAPGDADQGGNETQGETQGETGGDGA